MTKKHCRITACIHKC